MRIWLRLPTKPFRADRTYEKLRQAESNHRGIPWSGVSEKSNMRLAGNDPDSETSGTFAPTSLDYSHSSKATIPTANLWRFCSDIFGLFTFLEGNDPDSKPLALLLRCLWTLHIPRRQRSRQQTSGAFALMDYSHSSKATIPTASLWRFCSDVFGLFTFLLSARIQLKPILP